MVLSVVVWLLVLGEREVDEVVHVLPSAPCTPLASQFISVLDANNLSLIPSSRGACSGSSPLSVCTFSYALGYTTVILVLISLRSVSTAIPDNLIRFSIRSSFLPSFIPLPTLAALLLFPSPAPSTPYHSEETNQETTHLYLPFPV